MVTSGRNPLATSFLHKFWRGLKIACTIYLPVVSTLLAGMVLNGTTSVARIHRNITTSTSQGTFYRQVRSLVRQLPHACEQILASAQQWRSLRMRPAGFLILDEHIIPHASKNLEGADKYYSPSDGTYKVGHSLIAVHYRGGRAEYPVAGAFYRRERELKTRNLEKEFRKKNAIAREFFRKIAQNPNAPRTWLLDAYFVFLAANGIEIDKKQVTSTAPMCPRCGTANLAGTRFCNRCGSPMTLKAAMEIESDQVTLMQKTFKMLAENPQFLALFQ